MTAVAADTREKVLRIASSITSERHDATAVVRNFVPMLFWLEAAADDGDLTRRLAALDRMWANITPDDYCGGGDRSPLADAPAEFVAGAEILYLAVTGDPEIPEGLDSGGDV